MTLDIGYGSNLAARFPYTIIKPIGAGPGPAPVLMNMLPESTAMFRYGRLAATYTDGTVRADTGEVLLDRHKLVPPVYLAIGDGTTSATVARLPNGDPIPADFAALLRGETPPEIVAAAQRAGVPLADVLSGHTTLGVPTVVDHLRPVEPQPATLAGSGTLLYTDGSIRYSDGTVVRSAQAAEPRLITDVKPYSYDMTDDEAGTPMPMVPVLATGTDPASQASGATGDKVPNTYSGPAYNPVPVTPAAAVADAATRPGPLGLPWALWAAAAILVVMSRRNS